MADLSFTGEDGWNDCAADPGPIISLRAAAVLLVITNYCDPSACRGRARALAALLEWVRGAAGAAMPLRQCADGPALAWQQRIDTAVEALLCGPAAEIVWGYCRIDPGAVSVELAHVLARVHRACSHERCCPARRAHAALTGSASPPPICRVPDHAIARAVERVNTSRAAVRALRVRLTTGDTGTVPEFAAALAQRALASRSRDLLFLAALPGDGTVPSATLAAFGLTARDLVRLTGPQPRPALAGPFPKEQA
ncbi:hypothetical protein GZH49_12035 [Nocardia terpenica]|uniref:hypothetical protein n=1 Tax=Nocardia terpenica TaxID=455432 RepID=UPI002FE1C4F6